ncbi:MAG TPA: PA0069 family radical SAM protein, partial [Inquilinus sp.]|nr:PA0069 family radical SAM protein [Inquilinus sp.]
MPLKPPEIEELADRPRKGRGAVSNKSGRYEAETRHKVDDGWMSEAAEEDVPPLRTTLHVDTARTIITRNDSPDILFDRSINPYRGCEHGCIYCFARPTHAWLGLSPGLDFETQLFYKPDAPALLEAELRRPGYSPAMMAMGTNTDPYQPVERELQLTRRVIEVLSRFNHPLGIVTKSALITRDIDLLAPMAAKGLAGACISLSMLDRDLARSLEPRAATPPKRLETIRRLADAGIPVSVLTSPMIPGLNDHMLEQVLEA